MSDIISAISTASGVGGVAIIRLSGENSLKLASKMFKPLGKTKVLDFEPYKMYVGEIDAGNFTDFGMCVFFKGPKSYTGEDMVEFHCHGGIAISQGILKQTFKLGSMPANRGEFTKRAFINGKLSLDSCEGLIGMINGESTAQVKASYSLYKEKLYKTINELQDKLTYSLASINADIDYPEEDLESLCLDNVKNTLSEVKDIVSNLVKTYSCGKKIKNGVKVAIVGKPNTGKSSLLNSLINYDKAIVSNVAGTTRDIVEGELEINGVLFNLYDTAGIHESKDEVEKIGIERSKKIINSADIILLVLDSSENLSNDDFEIIKSVENKNIIKIYNKTDKDVVLDTENGIKFSAKTGVGYEELKTLLYNNVFENSIDQNSQLIVEERHFKVLTNTLNAIEDAICGIGVVPLDLVGEDIKKVWDLLGEITGKTANEDIITEIFSKFCVGK